MNNIGVQLGMPVSATTTTTTTRRRASPSTTNTQVKAVVGNRSITNAAPPPPAPRRSTSNGRTSNNSSNGSNGGRRTTPSSNAATRTTTTSSATTTTTTASSRRRTSSPAAAAAAAAATQQQQKTTTTINANRRTATNNNSTTTRTTPTTTTTTSVLDTGASSSAATDATIERKAKDVILPADPDTDTFRKLFRGVKLLYQSFPRDCISVAADEMGLVRTPKPEGASVFWVEHNPLTTAQLRCMEPDQRVNCFVGMKDLCYKDTFFTIMNLARSMMGDDAAIFDCVPRTFVFPNDAEALEQVLARSRGDYDSLSKKRVRGSRFRMTTMGKLGGSSTTATATMNRLSTMMNQTTNSSTLADSDDDTASTTSDLHRSYLQLARKENTSWWIVKPGGQSCGGEGITVRSAADVMSVASSMPGCVVQSYIAHPLTLAGFKWDMRLYVVVTSLLPLRFHVQREGLARFATAPYEYPSKKNCYLSNSHLTNYSLNKYSKEFKDNVNENFDEECTKRALSTAFAQIQAEYGEELFDQEEVWERICDLVETTLTCMLPYLLLQSDRENTCNATSIPFPCFHVLGFDVLLDSAFECHLLELNNHPSLITDAPIDMLVKGVLARHLLRIVLHPVARRNRRRLRLGGRKKKVPSSAETDTTTTTTSSSSSPAATTKQNATNDNDDDNDDEIDAENDDQQQQQQQQDDTSASDTEAVVRLNAAALRHAQFARRRAGVVVAGDAAASSATGTACPLPANAAAAAATLAQEENQRSLARQQYEDGEHSDLRNTRDVPKDQAEWERMVCGPIMLPCEPDIIGSSPLYRVVVQPLLRLRDIFVAQCGGAASKNRSDTMNQTRFVRFARRFGILSTGTPTVTIDLMYQRHVMSKQSGSPTGLTFTDFVWLLMTELGPGLVPSDGSDRLRAVVDFLDTHDQPIASTTTNQSGAVN